MKKGETNRNGLAGIPPVSPNLNMGFFTDFAEKGTVRVLFPERSGQNDVRLRVSEEPDWVVKRDFSAAALTKKAFRYFPNELLKSEIILITFVHKIFCWEFSGRDGPSPKTSDLSFWIHDAMVCTLIP